MFVQVAVLCGLGGSSLGWFQADVLLFLSPTLAGWTCYARDITGCGELVGPLPGWWSSSFCSFPFHRLVKVDIFLHHGLGGVIETIGVCPAVIERIGVCPAVLRFSACPQVQQKPSCCPWSAAVQDPSSLSVKLRAMSKLRPGRWR